MKYSIHECPVSGHLCNCDEPCYGPGAKKGRSWTADEFTLRDDDGNEMNRTIVERIEEIEQRMNQLEPHFGNNHGTVLQRVAAPIIGGGGVQWSLGIGFLMMPKVFFRGQDIDKLLDEAEAHLAAQENMKLTAYEGVPFAIVKNEES